MIVRRAVKNSTVVPGGGAIDVCQLSRAKMIQPAIQLEADVDLSCRWK